MITPGWCQYFFFSYQTKMAAQEWPVHLRSSGDKIVLCGCSDNEFSPSEDPITTTLFSSVYPRTSLATPHNAGEKSCLIRITAIYSSDWLAWRQVGTVSQFSASPFEDLHICISAWAPVHSACQTDGP